MSKNILKSSAPLRVGTAASNPASAQNGTIYYNTTDNVYRLYENGQWQDLATKAFVDALQLDDLNDIALAGEANGDVLVFNGTNWVNQATISTAGSGAGDLITTTSGGFLDESFLQFNIDFGGNVLTGVATPSGSSDVANKAYVDSAVSGITFDMQNIYDQDTDGSNVIITTNSVDGNLVIAGSEKLVVSATQGLDVTHALTAGSGYFSVSTEGDLSKIRNVSYVFPATQASSAASVLVNDGSGTLSWLENSLNNLSDVVLVSSASGQVLRYNAASSSWVNEAPLAQRTDNSDAGKLLVTDGSGFLHESFLQFDIDFGGHILSGVDEVQGAGTLQLRPVDGVAILASSASSSTVLSVYGAVAHYDKDHNTEYVSEKVVAETSLSGSTTASIASLGFDSSTVKGALVEYRMYDTTTNDCRVGVIKIAVTADGDDVSLADSYVETADLDVSWSAAVSLGAVSVSYTSGSGTKNFKAKVKFI